MKDGQPAQVEALAKLARDLGRVARPADAAKPLAAFFEATMPVGGLFAAAYDEATRVRRCVMAYSAGEGLDPASLPPLPLNDGPASQAILRGAPVVTGDYQQVLRRQFSVNVGMHKDPRLPQSALAAPIFALGRVAGSLEVQSTEPDAYRPAHVPLVEAAAGLLAPLVAPAVPFPTEESKGRAEQALARSLVREMLDRIARRGSLRPEVLRGLGRDLGGSMHAHSLESHLAAFASMGLGELRVASDAPDRVVIHGHDLLERGPRSSQPTCFVTLGYLEGALGDLRGREALGAETACESQGRHQCVFVLALRAGARVAAAEAASAQVSPQV